MIDISTVTDDIGLVDALTPRAANILSVQLGTLEYEPTFGIDLAYFLSEDFQFQNSSFKSYLIQRLADYSINVTSVNDNVGKLLEQYVFNLSPAETTKSLVSR